MGRRASHPRLSSVAAGLAALALVGSGCTPVGPPSGDPQDNAVLAARLNTAVHDRSPGAFAANFAGDFSTSVLAYRWYGLMAATGATVSAGPGRSQLVVAWTLPGDRHDASTVVDVVRGTRDGHPVITWVAAGERSPLWTQEFVTVSAASHGTVLSPRRATDELRRYATRLDAAVSAVEAAGVVAPGAGWNGKAVVALPDTMAAFDAVTGFDSDDTAGVTDCDTGTPRITMNPELPEEWFDTTLLHEVVHAATNSPCSRSYPWAAEGLAEWVAEQADERLANENRQLVKSYLSEHGIPDSLPDAITSRTDYALASVAVGEVFAHLSHAKAVDLLDELVRRGGVGDRDWESAVTWYTAELARRSG